MQTPQNNSHEFGFKLRYQTRQDLVNITEEQRNKDAPLYKSIDDFPDVVIPNMTYHVSMRVTSIKPIYARQDQRQLGHALLLQDEATTDGERAAQFRLSVWSTSN